VLAVASGGTSLGAIRAGRQRTFTLVFDEVDSLAHTATRFQISLEPK